VSLDALDTEAFATKCTKPFKEFATRKVDEAVWNAFAQNLTYVPLTAGPAALKAAVEEAERSLGQDRAGGCTT
jgi:glucose-6-phosphate 1-dehydrogenase